MQNDAAPVGTFTMLEQVHALPGAKRQLSMMNGNRELRLGKSRANVGRHIIRALRGVAIEPRVFGDESIEEIREISHHIGIGIFLNHQGCRSVLAEDSQKAGLGWMASEPGCDFARKFVQAFAVGRDVDLVGELVHSTVTLLARLRG
jgi:hypothetical protein